MTSLGASAMIGSLVVLLFAVKTLFGAAAGSTLVSALSGAGAGTAVTATIVVALRRGGRQRSAEDERTTQGWRPRPPTPVAPVPHFHGGAEAELYAASVGHPAESSP